MKPLLPLFLILTCAGCGTINTAFREDAVTARNLSERKSDCELLPRVYSGVMYGFCILNAEQAQRTGDGEVQFQLLDMAASGALDTLLLAYTVYLQQREGSIAVSRAQ